MANKSVSILTKSPLFREERLTSFKVEGINSTENISSLIEAIVKLTPLMATEPLYIMYFEKFSLILKKNSLEKPSSLASIN